MIVTVMKSDNIKVSYKVISKVVTIIIVIVVFFSRSSSLILEIYNIRYIHIRFKKSFLCYS